MECALSELTTIPIKRKKPWKKIGWVEPWVSSQYFLTYLVINVQELAHKTLRTPLVVYDDNRYAELFLNGKVRGGTELRV